MPLSSIYLDKVSESAKGVGIKRLAFSYYGGKFSHLNWLLPLLPPSGSYVEPFAGSAAVLLNRPPSPIETYNDIDGEVVNFFWVLREKPKVLCEKLELTPYSRVSSRRLPRLGAKTLWSGLGSSMLEYGNPRVATVTQLLINGLPTRFWLTG